MKPSRTTLIALLGATAFFFHTACKQSQADASAEKPNIVLIMTDDQGWGQTGYYNHPVLKTPNIDAMAANGLRLNRFYAGAPVCSPTRASVLTGRANDRTGVPQHGHALRLQEKTISEALKDYGYATGHFGKWHLNALRGPGIPVLADDPFGPKGHGFEEWMTTTNYFDLDPLFGSEEGFKQMKGDSSDVIVSLALDFIEDQKNAARPFFAVIWDGSPHLPFEATEADRAQFAHLDEASQKHYAELVAFDRSLGKLRKGLRDMGVADNTIVWFCSDNGGLAQVEPDSVGGLRGNKRDVWEGGLRVPAVIEWPARIDPRVTDYPASTMDIFPTIADLLGLPEDVLLKPVDGESIANVFEKEILKRPTPIPFHFLGKGALTDNDFKLVATDIENDKYELYNLATDPKESVDLSERHPEKFAEMKSAYREWYSSVQRSIEGEDYPEGFDPASVAASRFWTEDERYKKYFDEWSKKKDYKSFIRTKLKEYK